MRRAAIVSPSLAARDRSGVWASQGLPEPGAILRERTQSVEVSVARTNPIDGGSIPRERTQFEADGHDRAAEDEESSWHVGVRPEAYLSRANEPNFVAPRFARTNPILMKIAIHIA